MLLWCINRSTIFKPGHGWCRDATRDALQIDCFVQNNRTLGSPSGTNRWRNWNSSEGRLIVYFVEQEKSQNGNWTKQKKKPNRNNHPNISPSMHFECTLFHYNMSTKDLIHNIILYFDLKKLLPCTATLKFFSWSPPSLVATHWNRPVSDTWARGIISRQPLAASRSPSLCLTNCPSLYHLRMEIVTMTLFILCNEWKKFRAEVLRYCRCRCPSGLAFQLQRAIDNYGAVSHLVSSINRRRHWGHFLKINSPGWDTQNKQIFRYLWWPYFTQHCVSYICKATVMKTCIILLLVVC